MRRRRDDADNGFEAWGGYMQAKIAKLEEQFSDRTDVDKESNLFQGISIFVNGYTNPSADQLKVLMARHGGVYHTYQRSSDYIIASNLPDTKVKRLTSARVVRPEWITESIAAGRVLDYREYLAYSRHTRTQPQLTFHKPSRHADLASHSGAHSYQADVKPGTGLHSTRETEDIPHTNVTTGAVPSAQKVEEDIANTTAVHCDAVPEQSSVPSDTVCSSNVVPSSLASENQKSSPPELSSRESRPTETTVRTAVDPNFLSDFYSNSRLHHISQLGTGFKQYINELRESSDFVFPALLELREIINNMEQSSESPITAESFQGGRVIMHLDMDCFFVSVGLRSRPELRGAPVAVTHAARGGARPPPPPPPRRGVDRHAEFSLYRQRKARALSKTTGLPQDYLLDDNVMDTRVDGLSIEGDTFSSMSEIASCSYEARKKGVRNGMFLGAALRLCPELKTIPYDFDAYKEVAYTLYNTIAKYTLDIEAVSCDEMYVDCTELGAGGTVRAVARALRSEIRRRTGCACSAGFGGNRLQARLATKRAKPDGQFFLTADLLDSFMADVPLEDLPGVGRQTARQLAGVCAEGTCGALRTVSLTQLQRCVGAAVGRRLHRQCRGGDAEPLAFLTIRKSVSAEVNYGIRFENQDQCDTFLRQLCREVHERMRNSKVMGKSITLKLMVRAESAPVETAKFMGHGFCDTVNKTTTLPVATEDLQIITREVLNMCKKQKLDPKEMRGIGIQITKLESTHSKRPSKSAIQAFLTKPGSKNQETNREATITHLIESKRTPERDTQTANEQLNEVQKELERTAALGCDVTASVLRTPTKQILRNDGTLNKADRTPMKILQLQSPSANRQSPSKKKSLGLTGRRRGRPPKSAVCNVTSKLSASKEVMDKFLLGHRMLSGQSEAASVDPEILSALPEDIRQEVMKHYKIKDIPKNHSEPNTQRPIHKPKDEKLDVQELMIPPSTNSLAVVNGGGNSSTCDDSERDTLQLPWRQVQHVVRAWLDSGAAPLACDAALVSTYMQNLVIARSIDKLLVSLNMLRRKVQQRGDQAWLDMYSLILDGVQQTVTAVYGKPLLID